MKNEFARIGKNAMSLALAFAVVAVSMFTVIAVNVSAETSAVTELTWDGTYTEPTVKDGDTVIIKTAAEFAWVALKGGSATAGKTYKVADGIKSIYVNDVKDLTLAQVKDNLNGKGKNVWKYQDAVFQGTLDGNGVTVYGLYSTGADNNNNGGGLLPCASGTVTVKNIRVSTSYIGGNLLIGGLIGRLPMANATISLDNCAVVNSYLFTTTTGHGWHNGAVGLCGGGETPTSFTVNNCLVANNEFYSTCGEQNSAFVGQFNINQDVTFKVSNSIVLGVTPVPSNGGGYWVRQGSCYENVYTDFDVSKAAWGDKAFAETSVKQITLDQIKGDAAKTNTKLDFAKTWWVVKDSTPELRTFHTVTVTDNKDGTHSTVCSVCKKAGISEAHDYKFDLTNGTVKCACGAKVTNLTLTWDGTVATELIDKIHKGTTPEDAIIITSPSELAYLVVGAGGTTLNKYYKIADGIKAFNMNGMTGITVSSTAAQVETAAANPNKNWRLGEGSTTNFNSTLWNNYFQGSFDGNGIVIYNLYTTGSQWSMWAGLFPNVKASTTQNSIIENLTITASYFKSNAEGNASTGPLVARVSPDTDQKQLVVKNTAITNCVVKSEKVSASVIGNTTYNWADMYDVFVSGITTDTTFVGFIGGSTSSQHYIKNALSIGATAYKDDANENNWNNVYSTETTTTKNVTVVTAAQITGAAAKETLVGFDFDKVWFANTSTPVLRVSHNIKATSEGEAGHKESCADCSISDFTTAHEYNTDTHKCTVCGYDCNHTGKKWQSNNDGDCSKADTGKYVCDCGYESEIITNPDFTIGHNLVYVPAQSGNCADKGYIAHKYCSQCKKYFSADEIDITSTNYVEFSTLETATVAENHKKIVFVEKVDPTVENTGKKSHYECEGCHKLFSDKDGNNEITEKDIEIPKVVIEPSWNMSDSGWYYEFSDGTFATGWTQINGQWYYFNVSGYMVSNTWVDGYYLSASGAMTTPTWQLNASGWWYSYGDGNYAIGWTNIGETWYYFNNSGYMLTGWAQISGDWYCFNNSGVMLTGWVLIGNDWYYFNASGDMVSNAWIGGYYLAPSGVMATPTWKSDAIGWWYSYGDGSYAIGWEQINGQWYYFNASGYMLTGWQFVDDIWYYFDASGVVTAPAWQSDDIGYWYAYGDGSYAIGWLQIAGNYYYFNTNGYVATGWLEIGTTKYYLNDEGIMVTGWQVIDGARYYFDENGTMLKNCWVGNEWLSNSGAVNEL